MSISRDLNNLKRKVKSRESKPVQTAVVGLLPGILGDALAAMSRAGQKLPKSVPGYGALPPGDVVNIHHFTPDKSVEVLDPAKWGARAGTLRNAERSWVEGTPDVYPMNAYLPDYGYTNENLFGTDPKLIAGGVPGMYNMDADPLGIYQIARDRAKQGAGYYPVTGGKIVQEASRELQERGYTGAYYPETPSQGGAAHLFDLVDTRAPGNYPNIAQMRAELGLSNEPRDSLFPMTDRDIAAVTLESQPGKDMLPTRYRKFKNPTAAWLLHRDYERFLRNPDGSSVVASYMDIPASVYQGAGYFKGQKNPMSGLRVAQEGGDPSKPLTPDQRARMDAIALAEGVLRDQDATAWSRPYELKPAPTPDDTAVLLRSEGLGAEGLASVARALEKEPLGPYAWDPTDKKETMADHVAIVPNPSGAPGVFVFRIDEDLPLDVFQDIMARVGAYQEKSLGYRGVRDFNMEWGKHDTGYFEYKDYAEKLDSLPDPLKSQAKKAIEALKPGANAISGYHARIRSPRKPSGTR
jgi:hypothetical protein